MSLSCLMRSKARRAAASAAGLSSAYKTMRNGAPICGSVNSKRPNSTRLRPAQDESKSKSANAPAGNIFRSNRERSLCLRITHRRPGFLPASIQNLHFRFAAIEADAMLSAMAIRKFLPLGFSLTAIAASAAEQIAGAAAEKAKQTTPIQDKIISYVIDHSGKLIGAAVVVAIGLVVSRFVANFAGRWLEKKPLEPPVRLLMVRVARVTVLAVALLIALGTAGADVTALVAGLSVAGVGVGLAMQGVLSNLFAGLTIIFTKPFRVGEYIQLLGTEGQ